MDSQGGGLGIPPLVWACACRTEVFLLKDSRKEDSESREASMDQKELGTFGILLLVVVADIHNFSFSIFRFQKIFLSFLILPAAG